MSSAQTEAAKPTVKRVPRIAVFMGSLRGLKDYFEKTIPKNLYSPTSNVTKNFHFAHSKKTYSKLEYLRIKQKIPASYFHKAGINPGGELSYYFTLIRAVRIWLLLTIRTRYVP